MTEYTLEPKPVLDNFSRQVSGAKWTEKTGDALFSVAPYHGRQSDLEKTLKKTLGPGLPAPGPSLPAPGHVNFTGDDGETCIMSTARDQWFIRVGEHQTDLLDALPKQLEDIAAVTDQTDAWVQIELCATVPLLERLCPIDLHPDHFPVGAAARTMIEHMGVIIARLPTTNNTESRFLLLSPRSSAKSFLQALIPDLPSAHEGQTA